MQANKVDSWCSMSYARLTGKSDDKRLLSIHMCYELSPPWHTHVPRTLAHIHTKSHSLNLQHIILLFATYQSMKDLPLATSHTNRLSAHFSPFCMPNEASQQERARAQIQNPIAAVRQLQTCGLPPAQKRGKPLTKLEGNARGYAIRSL